MAKISFYNIENAEKEAIFQAIAGEKGMTPFAVEKDWWVSRTLEIEKVTGRWKFQAIGGLHSTTIMTLHLPMI